MTTEAAGSEVTTAEVNNGAQAFCVIGETVNSSFGRTWKKTLVDAAKHAEKIIKRSHENGNKKVHRLFVVQVVEVVEVQGVPVTHRPIQADDLSSADTEGD